MVQIAEDDHDALEVLAFSGSYAGKLEERREIENVEVEDASKISERQEEQKIAEDKRKGINEGSDEAGPSVFCPTYADYTSWTTTQGSTANRQSRAGSQEVEADSD